MSLGEQLRNARMARKETTSQVAVATRLKIQVVEAIEREDFSKIPATIYGKGFIKMFAEHVGLDPQPLVQEYAARFSGPNRPSLESPVAESVEKAAEAKPEPASTETEKEKEKEKEKESSRRSRRNNNKDFFEPDLFAHAGISTLSPPASEPASESDPRGAPVEPALPAGEEPAIQTPVVGVPVGVPLNSLEEPSAPDPTPSPVVSGTESILHAPGGRETTDSALHAAPAWGVKHTPISRRPMVDHDLLLHKKPVAATEPVVEEPKEDQPGDEPERFGMGRMDFRGLDLSRSPAKLVFLLLGVLIILAFIISGLSRCSRKPDVRQAPPPANASKELRIAVDPPAPYFD